MKVRRHKNHRRTLRFYRLNFGVQDPFRILIDGTFITHALQHKIHVREQLPKILEGRATPMVTNCVVAELRKLGDRALGAAIIAKGYYRVKCGHDSSPMSAAACIRCQIGEKNERKLLVATQDIELARELRTVPGVPMLRLDGPVPRVEDPSEVSRAVASNAEAAKLRAADWERRKLPELQAREQQAKARAVAADAAVRKRRGPKGPNPLSCKKKSTKSKASPGSSGTGGANGAGAKAAPSAGSASGGGHAAAAGDAGAVGEAAGKKKRVRSRHKPPGGDAAAASGQTRASSAAGAGGLAETAAASDAVAPPPSKKQKRVRSRRMGSRNAALPEEDAA